MELVFPRSDDAGLSPRFLRSAGRLSDLEAARSMLAETELLPAPERLAVLTAVGLALIATFLSFAMIVGGSANAAITGKPAIISVWPAKEDGSTDESPPVMGTITPMRRAREVPPPRSAKYPRDRFPRLRAALDSPPATVARRPSPADTRRPQSPAPSEAPAQPIAAPSPPRDHDEPSRQIRVRGSDGKMAVARIYGREGKEVHVLLPDGQLGIVDDPAFVPDPFVPATADEIEHDLLDGPFAGFKSLRTVHYLNIYQSSAGFAQKSGEVLERLYKGLADAFRKFDVPVHDAEFPLVAVIFRDEADFRAHKKVAPEIQAYYEIYSNRIFFYETSAREDQSPEIAALRRPQTVAHEGTHQILQNIGIHPRLSPWPAWLIEGLAEYCATPVYNKKGMPTWSGLGMVNPLHMATIRDLDDPLSGQVAGTMRTEHIGPQAWRCRWSSIWSRRPT